MTPNIQNYLGKDISISRVTFSDTKNNGLLRQQCEEVSKNGGRFSITSEYAPGSCWFNTYTIYWPDRKDAK